MINRDFSLSLSMLRNKKFFFSLRTHADGHEKKRMQNMRAET